ncbi:MAG: hypothetical protein EA397_03745 [Deltaproteobacteria bacterium]|nr:MAG: hypothetical protein EA397_03745 [Deltaproteobacteria bacterium]
MPTTPTRRRHVHRRGVRRGPLHGAPPRRRDRSRVRGSPPALFRPHRERARPRPTRPQLRRPRLLRAHRPPRGVAPGQDPRLRDQRAGAVLDVVIEARWRAEGGVLRPPAPGHGEEPRLIGRARMDARAQRPVRDRVQPIGAAMATAPARDDLEEGRSAEVELASAGGGQRSERRRPAAGGPAGSGSGEPLACAPPRRGPSTASSSNPELPSTGSPIMAGASDRCRPARESECPSTTSRLTPDGTARWPIHLMGYSRHPPAPPTQDTLAMLTGLSLKNVGPFAEANLALGPMSVIVGPNNSGKTTLLRALACLAHKQGEQPWSGTSIAPRIGATESSSIRWEGETSKG